MTDDLLLATEDTLNNPYYLRNVTDMAERCAVVTQDAIYSDKGIKLVEKGARIDSRMYDRLVQHKLRQPVDASLTVDNAVSLETLSQQAREILDTRALPQLLQQALGGPESLLTPLQHIPLTDRMAFKLTVMREQMPGLFVHSLEVALAALFLGRRSQWSEKDCIALAAAALLHDLGVLHMDPAWRDPGNRVTGAARKHLVAHPITAMLMVRDAKVYDPRVETAILEHHERMDGTGYPRGTPGNAISAMGQIILLAEVVAAFFEKYPDSAAQQLSLVLRLNHRKFPKAHVAHVLPLLQSHAHADRPLPDQTQFQALAAKLVQAFDQWDQAKAIIPQEQKDTPDQGPLDFVEGRIAHLRRALIEAGAQPENHRALLEQLQGDEEGVAELAYVVREALWQLLSIVHSCERRWPEHLSQRSSPQNAATAQWCDWVRSLSAE